MYLSLHSRDLIDIPTLAYFDLPLTLLSLSASYSLSNASPPNSHSSSPLYFHINKNLYSLSPSSGYPSSVITISSSSPSSTTLTSLSLSLFFFSQLFCPPFSVHSCGLSPQAVMQSSDSCAQSQGLESTRQPSRGVTTPHSVGKQQERKEERWGEERKGEMKPMREGRKTV